ncbi:hypothetical protein D3C72_713700 [compost metagenome]
MQTKITAITLSILSLMAFSTSQAASSLKVTVKGRYSTQSTEIFRDMNDWVCKTEHNPYVPSKTKPYSDAKLKTIATMRPSKKECRDLVIISDLTAKPAKTYSGCADDMAIKPFLAELNKNCGR